MAKTKINKRNSKIHGCGKQNNKRGRLIVRNLPFTVTEEEVRIHFAQFGEVNDISILKRADGKLVGCGFVQYTSKQNAAKAISNLSGKDFKGRTIIVDWSVPKLKFSTPSGTSKHKEIKSEPEDCDKNSEVVEKQEESEEIKVDKDDLLTSSDSENENDEDYSISAEQEDVKPPKPSHDIGEGKTVFLKNVPFTVNNEELKQYMEESYGSVYYAVICIDPLTEHSKGTAFVKFKDSQNAENCLNSVKKLKIRGCIMEAWPALDRNQLKKQERDKQPVKKKDNRNLYLVKEGVVTAGTNAAKDVSIIDMKKRLDLELWKSNMLRNLNMFVSRTRLIIHNLPSSYDDADLKQLFKKYSPSKSIIKEARVMKNMRDINADGKPTSKEYGFVSFTQHDDALAALRAVNNNPKIFNKMKRPIVAFSIENRAVLAAKEKRLEKSKANNPLHPSFKRMGKNRKDNIEKNVPKKVRNNQNTSNFSGMESKPGVSVRFDNKFKLRTQVKTHMQTVREEKRNISKKRKVHNVRNEKNREKKMAKPALVKQKKKADFGPQDFDALVNKYREKMSESFKSWYE